MEKKNNKFNENITELNKEKTQLEKDFEWLEKAFEVLEKAYIEKRLQEEIKRNNS